MTLFDDIWKSSSSTIYHFGELCIKEYNPELHLLGDIKKYIMDKDVFDKLKLVDNPAFVHLIDYNLDDNNLIKNYMYEYIPAVKEILPHLPLEYTIVSLRFLIDLADHLTCEGIYMFDPNPGNVIITGDGLRVIDTDLYRFDSYDKVSLKKYNRNMALRYVLNKYIEGDPVVNALDHPINQAFSIDPSKYKDPADEVYKRIKSRRFEI